MEKYKIIILCLIVLSAINCTDKKHKIGKSGAMKTVLISEGDINLYFAEEDKELIENSQGVITFLKAKKNNYIHYYLKKSPRRIYLTNTLDNIITIDLNKNGPNYISPSMLDELNREYVENYIDSIIPFLKEKGIEKLGVKMEKIVDIDHKGLFENMEPPTSGIFYGNFNGGRIPPLVPE